MKMAVVRFYRFLDQNINLNNLSHTLAWILSASITLYCLILLSLPLFETTAPKGIVFARDNDAGRAMEVSIATKWYNSNHFAPYGNLYYRMSHTLADLIHLPENSLNEVETREKSHGLALKLVSLLSLFALGFFIGHLLLGLTPESLLFSSVFTLTALRIPLWTEWVFRPHPEHTLILFLGMSLYFFSKFLTNPKDRRYFVISALLWGIAMAVKRSTSAFVPAILLFLLFPLNKQSLKRTLEYVGLMLFSYLLVGFPQNFGFVKHINFLIHESAHHSLADYGTIMATLKMSWDQFWILAIPVAVATLFSSKKEKTALGQFFLFISLASVPVLLRKMGFPGEHHTMPLAISFLIFLLVALIHLNPFRITHWKRPILIVSALISLKLLGVPNDYLQMRNKQLLCRGEMTEINKLVHERISPQFMLLKEAYYPFDSEIKQNMITEWEIKWEFVHEKVGLIGIDQSSYGGPVTDFYSVAKNQDVIQSPDGRTFKKIFSSCGKELWSQK